MGAPVGNKNAIGSHDTEKPFRDALRRAIAQDDGKRLRATAERLLDLAAAGEAWAVKELAERIDGKAQTTVKQNINVEHSGTVEHRAISEVDKRIAELLGTGTNGDSPTPLPH